MNSRDSGLGTRQPADKAGILELFDRYISTIVAHDGEGWMALWDEEGVQLPPNQPMHVGKQEIRSANFDFFNDSSRSWIFDIDTQEVLVLDGGYAIARGLFGYTATPVDGRPPLTMDGKFMTLFKKQPDGHWLLYRDCFNSNTSEY